MGERGVRNAEVRGSIPLISIPVTYLSGPVLFIFFKPLIRRRYFLIQCGSPEEKEEQKPPDSSRQSEDGDLRSTEFRIRRPRGSQRRRSVFGDSTISGATIIKSESMPNSLQYNPLLVLSGPVGFGIEFSLTLGCVLTY